MESCDDFNFDDFDDFQVDTKDKKIEELENKLKTIQDILNYVSNILLAEYTYNRFYSICFNIELNKCYICSLKIIKSRVIHKNTTEVKTIKFVLSDKNNCVLKEHKIDLNLVWDVEERIGYANNCYAINFVINKYKNKKQSYIKLFFESKEIEIEIDSVTLNIVDKINFTIEENQFGSVELKANNDHYFFDNFKQNIINSINCL